MKRKATYQPERRTHIAHARMNDEEWAQFLSQLEKLGLSQSDFIRQAIATAQVKVTVQPVSTKKQHSLAQRHETLFQAVSRLLT